MIRAQPYLGDIVKSAILCNFSGIDVTVVIKYWGFLRVIVVQLLSCFGAAGVLRLLRPGQHQLLSLQCEREQGRGRRTEQRAVLVRR